MSSDESKVKLSATAREVIERARGRKRENPKSFADTMRERSQMHLLQYALDISHRLLMIESAARRYCRCGPGSGISRKIYAEDCVWEVGTPGPCEKCMDHGCLVVTGMSREEWEREIVEQRLPRFPRKHYPNVLKPRKK